MKRLLIPVLILGLAAIAYTLVKSNQPTPGDEGIAADRLFAVEESRIAKIEIEKINYPKTVLYKSEDGWRMNNDRKVNPLVMDNMINLFTKIEVDYIPTEAMKKQIFKDLEKNAIRVKIYDSSGNKIRDYQVATETGNAQGTPFVVTGEEQPYVLRIKGFEGSLRTRLNKRFEDWRSKDVYTLNPEDVLEIDVRYERDPNSSFILSRDGDQFNISRPDGTPTRGEINQKTAAAYLDGFRSVIAEYNDSENPNREGITSTQRFAQIKIKTKDGENSVIDFYSYADISVNFETKGPQDIHPDNKFFAETNENEMFLIQQRILKPIWRSYDYFLSR